MRACWRSIASWTALALVAALTSRVVATSLDSASRNYLVNPTLSETEGAAPRGWRVGGEFRYDAKSRCAVFSFKGDGSLSQAVDLPPGHYLLRALARASSIEAMLSADSLDYDMTGSFYASGGYGGFRTPIGVSREFKIAELPFFVERGNGPSRSVTVGFRHHFRVPHQVRIEIKEAALNRLGDTVLQRRWAQNWPVDPHHGLETLREAAHVGRPGRAIFTGTGAGAEVWLMTQGGGSRLQYVGTDVFSPEGKYLYILGLGTIFRTDGSARYPGFRRPRGGTPWLAPWLARRLPKGVAPADWVEAQRAEGAVRLENLITRQEAAVALPQRSGWTLALLPTPGPQGLDPHAIDHDALVWLPADRTQIGVSDFDQTHFRTFDVKSIRPAFDKRAITKSFWAKGRGGDWFAGFCAEPGGTWVAPVAKRDPRGLMRVVDGDQYPDMAVKEYVLEDGTIVQKCFATHRAMDCELRYRMRGQADNTLALESVEAGEVRHVGSYPYLERIDWSRSPGFAVVESVLSPCPIFFVDVAKAAMWPISVTNYRDFGQRYKEKKRNSFYIAPNLSPDGTKIVYASTMLSAGKAGLGDVYVAVARYPQPPVRVRQEGDRLVRHFCEAETAQLASPLVPIFDPQNASNGYAVAITDPDLLYRRQLAEGLCGTGKLEIAATDAGSYKIMGRVRALHTDTRGTITISIRGTAAGQLTVDGSSWHWVALDKGPVRLDPQTLELQFATSSVGVALDNVLVTNDLGFEPTGKGNAPPQPPSRPQGLRIEQFVGAKDSAKKGEAGPSVSDVRPPFVKIAWQASDAPQGVCYYNVHRGTTAGLNATQGTLIGSSHEPRFVDCGLEQPQYFYRVVAVDNWGNPSQPSPEVVLSASRVGAAVGAQKQ